MFNQAASSPPNLRKEVGAERRLKCQPFPPVYFSTNGTEGEKWNILADFQGERKKDLKPAKESKEKGLLQPEVSQEASLTAGRMDKVFIYWKAV